MTGRMIQTVMEKDESVLLVDEQREKGERLTHSVSPAPTAESHSVGDVASNESVQDV